MNIELTALIDRLNQLLETKSYLLSRCVGLTTFQENRAWISDAKVIVTYFEEIDSQISQYCSVLMNEKSAAEEARKSLPFFKRLTASKAQEKSIQQIINDLDVQRSSLTGAIEELKSYIEQLPISKKDQQDRIAQLKLEKKETALAKREANEAVRQINLTARRNNAYLAGTRGGVARFARASIRQEKEKKVGSIEAVKADLENRIIEIDREVIWLGKFSGGDEYLEESVQRCAYCGRRIIPGQVCPGCGSD